MPHPASLVRLISGPGQGDNIEGRVTDFSSVLDATVPGRIKATMVGSYAQLSLPAEIAGRLASVHCWLATVPERATPQAVWSLGDIALVTASGRLELRSKTDVCLHSNAMIGKHWYSIVVTIGDGELSIDLKRLDGKVNSHRSFRTTTATTISSETLILAASGVGPSDRRFCPSTEDRFADAISGEADRRHDRSVARRRRSASNSLGCVEAWRRLRGETISPTLKDVPPGRLVNGVERGVTGRNWDGAATPSPKRRSHTVRCNSTMTIWSMLDGLMISNSHCRTHCGAASMPSGLRRREIIPTSRCCRPQDRNDGTVLFLIPTNTYLAYGNDHLASLDFSSVMPHDKVVPPTNNIFSPIPSRGDPATIPTPTGHR